MRLDRNITNPRRGKYALIKLREENLDPVSVGEMARHRLQVGVSARAIDFGFDENDFFVIRLKDKYASAALSAYAHAAMQDDPEYGREIMELAQQAMNHPNKRMPD